MGGVVFGQGPASRHVGCIFVYRVGIFYIEQSHMMGNVKKLFLAAKRSSTRALLSLSVRPSVRPFQNWISHCLVSLWQLMTAFDSLWQLLTAYDSLWQLLTAFDNFWQLLTTYHNLSQLMTTYDNLWQLMTTYDNLWQLLTTFDNFWQLMTTYTCTLCKLSSSQDFVVGLVLNQILQFRVYKTRLFISSTN